MDRLDKVYYYNRKGALALTVNEYPYFMVQDTGEFKDHLWEYDYQFGKYKSFRRGKKAYPFSIVIASDDDADYDALCDIFDEDVLAEEPGYFLINGWRLDCMVLQANHKFYGTKDYVIAFEALATNPVWTRQKTHTYNGTGSGSSSGEDLGRNYSYRDSILGRGYNYGYDEADSHYAILNMPGNDNGYEIIIYGPAINPTIYINNKPVRVNVTISEGEKLRIVSNGATKTIDIIQPGNITQSAFVYRDKENSPFLTLGKTNEITYGALRFELTTIERRSEPAWI